MADHRSLRRVLVAVLIVGIMLLMGMLTIIQAILPDGICSLGPKAAVPGTMGGLINPPAMELVSILWPRGRVVGENGSLRGTKARAKARKAKVKGLRDKEVRGPFHLRGMNRERMENNGFSAASPTEVLKAQRTTPHPNTGSAATRGAVTPGTHMPTVSARSAINLTNRYQKWGLKEVQRQAKKQGRHLPTGP